MGAPVRSQAVRRITVSVSSPMFLARPNVSVMVVSIIKDLEINNN